MQRMCTPVSKLTREDKTSEPICAEPSFEKTAIKFVFRILKISYIFAFNVNV